MVSPLRPIETTYAPIYNTKRIVRGLRHCKKAVSTQKGHVSQPHSILLCRVIPHSRLTVYEQDCHDRIASTTFDPMPTRQDANDIEEGSSQPLLNNHTDSQHVQYANPLNDIRTILFSGYINVLLICLPFAFISSALGWSSTVVFALNFFSLMPLASLLSFATEELSTRVGQGVGGLLNVTFGNITELIVGIVALRDGQVKLIQATMLGSILSSLLFVISCLLIVVYKLGTWGNIFSWGDTDCRISVQSHYCTDNEFIHVCRDRRFNPPRCL